MDDMKKMNNIKRELKNFLKNDEMVETNKSAIGKIITIPKTFDFSGSMSIPESILSIKDILSPKEISEISFMIEHELSIMPKKVCMAIVDNKIEFFKKISKIKYISEYIKIRNEHTKTLIIKLINS